MAKKILDTLSFSIDAETTVTNTTVKLTAAIVAVIDGEKITEENLATKVKETLNSFVGGEWIFQNPTRTRNDAGFEEARYTATVRVDQAENHDLDERREEASQRGLRITQVVTDTSTPKRAIAEAESALRVILLKRAQNQAESMSAAAGRTYRLHALDFAQMRQEGMNHRGMMMASATSYALESASPPNVVDVIGHTQKLTMAASVTLATTEGTN